MFILLFLSFKSELRPGFLHIKYRWGTWRQDRVCCVSPQSSFCNNMLLPKQIAALSAADFEQILSQTFWLRSSRSNSANVLIHWHFYCSLQNPIKNAKTSIKYHSFRQNKSVTGVCIGHYNLHHPLRVPSLRLFIMYMHTVSTVYK